MRLKGPMKTIVDRLRANGWRVRNGGWPLTRAAEARWDFCLFQTADDGAWTLCPMNIPAAEALDAQCEANGIP